MLKHNVFIQCEGASSTDGSLTIAGIVKYANELTV